MDLGLNKLTDDQLLELLQQACAELAIRDHYVRNLAQQTIFTEAEKLKAMKQEMEGAVAAAKAEHVAQLRQEIEAEVRRAVSAGEIQLFQPGEEPKIVVQTDLDVRAKMIQEIKAREQEMRQGSVQMLLALRPGGTVMLKVGDNTFEGTARVQSDAIQKIMQDLYVMLH